MKEYLNLKKCVFSKYAKDSAKAKFFTEIIFYQFLMADRLSAHTMINLKFDLNYFSES